jgi:predicted NBD/HSP70 family sugar kinase
MMDTTKLDKAAMDELERHRRQREGTGTITLFLWDFDRIFAAARERDAMAEQLRQALADGEALRRYVGSMTGITLGPDTRPGTALAEEIRRLREVVSEIEKLRRDELHYRLHADYDTEEELQERIGADRIVDLISKTNQKDGK